MFACGIKYELITLAMSYNLMDLGLILNNYFVVFCGQAFNYWFGVFYEYYKKS